MSSTYIAVDVGTSLTKATKWDAAGQLVASVERPTPISYPAPGRAEHDTDVVAAGAIATVAELVGHDRRSRPALLSITGQGDGCWLVDESGRGVGSAISWMDGRASAIIDGWARDGLLRSVYQYNGNALFPGSMAALLGWLDQHDPARLDEAVTAGYCKDVLFQRLTGVRATDPSDASLPFGQPDGTAYAAPVLEACGLSHRADLLPPIMGPLPVAPLDAAAAALTGLSEGTPVASGPFDLAASPLGGGVRRIGDGLLIIGTTLGCEVLVDSVDVSGDVTGMHLCTGTPGQWVRVLPAMAGCAALDWVLAMMGMSSVEVSAAIERSPIGATGVTALPYLAPSGERAPFVDHAVTGLFSGLRLTTTRDDLVRAMCEAIAFAAKDCFAATNLSGELTVTGGGANSSPWLQIFADVLERPLRVASAPNIGARGAVMSALAAAGKPVGELWTTAGITVEPDPKSTSRYAELWSRYCARRDASRLEARR